jgi:hypothetical protein
MEDVDTHDLNEHEEEYTFLCDVCDSDHELLFLDSYLRETFRGRPPHGPGTAHGGSGGEMFIERNTL